MINTFFGYGINGLVLFLFISNKSIQYCLLRCICRWIIRDHHIHINHNQFDDPLPYIIHTNLQRLPSIVAICECLNEKENQHMPRLVPKVDYTLGIPHKSPLKTVPQIKVRQYRLILLGRAIILLHGFILPSFILKNFFPLYSQ